MWNLPIRRVLSCYQIATWFDTTGLLRPSSEKGYLISNSAEGPNFLNHLRYTSNFSGFIAPRCTQNRNCANATHNFNAILKQGCQINIPDKSLRSRKQALFSQLVAVLFNQSKKLNSLKKLSENFKQHLNCPRTYFHNTLQAQ